MSYSSRIALWSLCWACGLLWATTGIAGLPGNNDARNPFDGDRLCGPHGLYLMLRLNDVTIDYERIMDYMPAHPNGMSLLELKQACAEFRLQTEVRQCSIDDLRSVPLPAIAHIYGRNRNAQGHYVMMTRITDDDWMEMIDTTTGEVWEYPVKKLGNIWKGYLLVSVEPSSFPWTAGGAVVVLPWLVVGCALLWRGSVTRPKLRERS